MFKISSINYYIKLYIQSCPHNNIDHKHQCIIPSRMYCNQSESTKAGRHQLDSDQSLAWGESHIQEFVMNMSLVGQEERFAVTCPAQNHAYYIQ